MVDEFLQAQNLLSKPGISGWWEEVLPALTEERRASLAQAAADRHISHRTISVVLGQWGFEVTTAQVGHWRRTHVG